MVKLRLVEEEEVEVDADDDDADDDDDDDENNNNDDETEATWNVMTMTNVKMTSQNDKAGGNICPRPKWVLMRIFHVLLCDYFMF